MKPLLTITALVALLCLSATSQAQASDDSEARSSVNVEELVRNDTRTVEELAGALCVNEATWRENDCIVIIQIRMRWAQQEGVSLRDALVFIHGDRSTMRARHGERVRRMTAALRSDRFTNPREGDSRRWIADLRADGHRPIGFDEDGSWENLYQREWLKIHTLVTGVIAGRVASPCIGVQPSIWGSPTWDIEMINAKLAEGYVRSNCVGTRNIFLSRPPAGSSAPNAPTPPRAPEPVVEQQPADVPRQD